ncbi:RNA 3'-terminal phosphate cyclase-like protein [Phasianus colchicus]|uniref:RNA 3'-terminal phosphate cyclase-like protein n=1 Tax=Phasianus colchicus TaxID=9054 RepID=UPI00129DC285|nr:RNA 3'-terminal phosphate cyclase-like protein [Phasianus colchicus]
MAGGGAQCLSFAGCNFLRQRLVLSTLSGRPLKIRKIRAKEEDPGLRDFEACFIRLIDKVTNGSRIEINQTGEICFLFFLCCSLPDSILQGGCVDSTNQSLALLLMTLGQQDVSKVLLGPLSPYTIEFLRHLRSFFQIMFKIEMKSPEEECKGGEKVLMTCVGTGFSNLSKTIR